MNEIIRELANQAGMVEVRYSHGFHDLRYPENFEKFANLVIKECADCLDDGGMDGLWVRQALAKHFGIE